MGAGAESGQYHSLFLRAATTRGLGALYGYRPLLLETLVDAQFRGTSYRAANWIYLGETRGRGRMDQHHEAHGRGVKRTYIYPLCRDVQGRLAEDSAPRWIPWEEE